jgi:hypothetical protein
MCTRCMDRLLAVWRAEGMRVGTLAESHGDLFGVTLPRHRIEWGEVAGRSGLLAVQGAACSLVTQT